MKKYLHILNRIVCAVLAIITISVVLKTWSEYGDLTLVSWLCAIIQYGGVFYLLYCLIKTIINKHIK